jgi:hypothetical protein
MRTNLRLTPNAESRERKMRPFARARLDSCSIFARDIRVYKKVPLTEWNAYMYILYR